MATRGERHNSYDANPIPCAANLVMFKISVGRDLKKNLTTSSTAQIQISTAEYTTPSFNSSISTLCLNGRNSTLCLHRSISTPSFQNPQILRTISSGNDVIYTQAPIPVWWVYSDNADCHILCARA